MNSVNFEQWPKSANIQDFYGRIEIGSDGTPTDRWESRALTQIVPAYPLRASWDTNLRIRKITCNRRVARSLSSIFECILKQYNGSQAAVQAAGLDLYGGCYCFRRVRGGAGLSLHSYGIAIDLDPDHNPLGKLWKPDTGMMPEAVIEIFAEHGWEWGGLWKRPDPMHFQAALEK
jgi:hypothetical protein